MTECNPVGRKARPTGAPTGADGGRKTRPTTPEPCFRAARAFTLFELLAVLAIVALVSALAFGGGQYAFETGKRLRAETELAALSAALESYQREFGDYPQTANAADLLQALIGRRGPTGTAVTSRCRLELARFHPGGNRNPLTDPTTELIDPWERSYVYAYKPTGAWTHRTYVLFSPGPDGQATPVPDSGVIDSTTTENLDNVYASPP